jgi:hypothetical protein
MSIIINNGSKESIEAFALIGSIQAKIKLGKSVERILNWLKGESCTDKKEESPDFILKGPSGVIGVEHFQVTAGSVEKNGKYQSLPNKLFSLLNKNNGNPNEYKRINELNKQALEANNYSLSICAFKYNFENHLKNTNKYKERINKYGDCCRLVFLIEMLYWDFTGLTAVGKKTFNCNYGKIPLCKDIVDIISTANDIDAVVISFNLYNQHASTVFAFTPQEAKNGDIGVDIYEYIGYSNSLEKELIKFALNGVTPDEIHNHDNYFEIIEAVNNDYKNFQDYILSGKSCIVLTDVYNFLVYNGLIEDKR